MNTPINLFAEIKEQAEKFNESISKVITFSTKKATETRSSFVINEDFNSFVINEHFNEYFIDLFNITVEGLWAVDPSLKIIFESGNELSVSSIVIGFNKVYFWEWNASKNEEKIKTAKKYGILKND